MSSENKRLYHMKSAKEVFKSTQILYLALLMGQMLFAGVVYFLLTPDNLNEVTTAPSSIFQNILPFVMVSSIGLAFYLYKIRLQQVPSMQDLSEKITHHRTTNIIRWAFIEGANFFALVVAMLEGTPFYLIYFGLGLLVFVFMRPTVNGFAKDYNLTLDEQRMLT